MILRNYDSIMQILTCGGATPSGPYDTEWLAGRPGIVRNHDGSYYFCTKTGNAYFGLFGCNSNSNDNYVSPHIYPVLLVGSGNNDVTYDDYTMNYLQDLSVAGYRGNIVTYSKESCTCVMTKTFINNTAEDITVNEIGIFTSIIGAKPTGSSTYSVSPLICREKLAEPVTLSANGGKATFSLTVNIPLMNKPSA